MSILKNLIFIALLFAGSYNCFAQEISIRGGFNLSQMAEKVDGLIVSDDPKLNPGFNFGPVIDFPVYKLFSFETGLLYSTKGLFRKGIYGNGESTYSWRLNVAYLEAPVTFKASLPIRNFELFGTAGGYIASGLFGSLLERVDISNNTGIWHKIDWEGEGISMKQFDYGLNFGIGAKFKYVDIGICYQIGAANLAKFDKEGSLYNRNIEIYLTYNLWKKTNL
ncbi:MAG: porin family protein [Bacteroidota bacterium]|nr:porin family protein [Bacteroidota bacterium]